MKATSTSRCSNTTTSRRSNTSTPRRSNGKLLNFFIFLDYFRCLSEMLYIAVFDIINKIGFHMRKKESVSKQLREKIKRLKKEELAYAALPGALPLGAAPVAGMAMGNRSGIKQQDSSWGHLVFLVLRIRIQAKITLLRLLLVPRLEQGLWADLLVLKILQVHILVEHA